MPKPFLQLTGLITCALLSLNACKPNSAATEQAKIEFEDIINQGVPKVDADDVDDFNDLVQHFAKTDDVHYRNAQGWTILHLACYFKKPELVRCLLLDGADPMALTTNPDDNEFLPGDTPMNMALLVTEDLPSSSEDIITIIKTLCSFGATMEAPLPQTLRPLDIAGLCSTEELFLYIARQSPDLTQVYQLSDGKSVNSLIWPCLRLWPKALQELLEKGCTIPKAGDPDYSNLLSYIFTDATPLTRDEQHCAELLLQHGADINAVDANGRTALFCLCELLLEQRDFNFDEDSLAQKILFLLSHGADPYQRATQHPTTPDFCAFDLIKMRPSLQQALDKAGYPLSEPAFILPEDDIALLACLCRDYLRLDAPTLFAPHRERLQEVILATGDICLHDFYPTAVKAVLRLLLQQDEEAANAFINSLPLWSQDIQSDDEQMQTLILELVELPHYQLDSSIITQLIEKLADSPQSALIRPLMLMLSRQQNDTAQAALQNYLKDERKALRLDAYCAMLQSHHLPAPGNSGIALWMSRYHLDQDQVLESCPELNKAKALNAYQELWFDLKTPQEVQFILDSLTELGFPQAADYSQRVHRAFNDPEALDKLSMEDTEDWMIDLDLAIADYIWQHREQLLALIDTTKEPAHDEEHHHDHVHGESCMH